MTQRLIIRLIPLEILVLSILAGFMAAMGVRSLIGAQSDLPSAAETAVAGAALALAPAPANGALAPIFTPEVQHWAGKIIAWSNYFQIDPNLAATVMQIESCGAPGVTSGSGAQGLFQVMPFHFVTGEDMLDPDTNAGRGLAYLSLGLSRASGDAGLALAGYNGGHSMIGRDSSLWPNETQRYWYWGTGIYQDAVDGAAQSGRLQEWLQAGGASLCATASQQLGLAQ
ncbi:MAG TPA: transglycosylase SLT domain-containing protein [Chloroflexia bacterium]|nr:transglycosylase SLT domain-containing protein [Chloroflexia bacterium]